MRYLIGLWLCGVVAGGLCLPAVADNGEDAPASEKVIEIRFLGRKQMSVNALMASIKLRAGRRYDDAVALEDEKRLLATGRFDSVEVQKTVTDQGVIVTFVLKERPIVGKLEILGNKHIGAAELHKELSFGTGDPLNAYVVEAGRQALVTRYNKNGYHFAAVTVDEKALAEQEVIYRVVEGPQVRITSLRFEGNEFFSNWRLRMEVATQSRLWPFIAGFLDMEQVERDIHTLRNLYISEGFLDVEVGRRPLEFSEDKTEVTLTFVIKEGPRYRINAVRFRGNTVFADEQLAGRLQLRPGKFFNADSLRLDLRAIEDAYGEIGYIHAAAEADKIYKEQPGVIDLRFTVREEDQYRIGQIHIRGNTVTQERVIRRELRFLPEQLYNTVAVRESRNRLEETRLFETVEITPVGRMPNTRDVLVRIAEGRTAEFLVGFGVSSNTGFLGNISFTQRNFDLFGWPKDWRQFFTGQAFKGAGQTFRLQAEPGLDMMSFNIELYEPALFDLPYSAGVKGFYYTRKREDYDESRLGGVVSLGHRFKNRWYGELAARIESIDLTSLDSSAPPEVVKAAGANVLMGLKGTLVRDRTDSRWMPTTGDRFRFSYEQVFGDFQFGRGTAEYRIYRTLYTDALDRKHILAARAAVGHIWSEAPVYEKFYGGGIGSVRGFKYRGISPRSAGTDKPIGGDFMAFLGAEYGFPLVADQLRGVVFVDSGTVEPSFEVNTWRASMGVGLRWVIPMMGPVPLSLDFGFPVSKNAEDDQQLVSFSLGWTF